MQKPKQAFNLFILNKKEKLSYHFRNASAMVSPAITRMQYRWWAQRTTHKCIGFFLFYFIVISLFITPTAPLFYEFHHICQIWPGHLMDDHHFQLAL
jgi:hypothetical protein